MLANPHSESFLMETFVSLLKQFKPLLLMIFVLSPSACSNRVAPRKRNPTLPVSCSVVPVIMGFFPLNESFSGHSPPQLDVQLKAMLVAFNAVCCFWLVLILHKSDSVVFMH